MSGALISPTTSLAAMQAAHTANAAKNVQSAKELERVEIAAREFESVFVSEMLKPMFEGIETDGFFGGGKGEEIFRGMLIQEYGKILTRSGSVGLSQQIKEQMIQLQEQADNASRTNA